MLNFWGFLLGVLELTFSLIGESKRVDCIFMSVCNSELAKHLLLKFP